MSGHPRVYLEAAKIDEIRAAATTPGPLNGASFSTARGTLEFDLWPRAKPEAEKTNSSVPRTVEKLAPFSGTGVVAAARISSILAASRYTRGCPDISSVNSVSNS